MGKSVHDMNEEAKTLYGTRDQTYDDFPVGTRVKIICSGQDFYFFWGETGQVVSNSHKYLGIQVKFDEPRHFKDGFIQGSFGFEPDDLAILNDHDYQI